MEDLWICSDRDSGEEWDDESNDRWVVCDSCGDRFTYSAQELTTKRLIIGT